MNWTIDWGDGEQTFSVLGLSRLRRRRLNQGRDTVTFRQESAVALTAPLAIEPFTFVRIRRPDVIWFSGKIIGLPTFGSGEEEARNYQIGGPWWDLENIVYQQPWSMAEDPEDPESELATAWKSHIILGQGSTGDRLTVREQLLQILDYAIDAGAALAYEIPMETLAGTFPLDECRDLSCAEAIQRVLRWAPAVRSWFDYSAEIPVLHFADRSTAPFFSVSLAAGSLQSLSIAPRPDLQLQAVAIKYERTHRAGGKVWQTLQVDRYPPDGEENRPRALVLTVELEGSNSQYVTQKISTGTVSLSSELWWKRHLPALENVENLQLLSVSRDSTLPRELLTGCISDWMAVDCESDVARATVASEKEGVAVAGQDVAVRFLATDGQTATYSRLSTYAPEEEAPEGLAQAFFESLSASPYEGTVRLAEEEVPAIPMGALLQITDGQAAWATMGAEIQECEEDVDGGIAELRFGPPAHLGLKQLIQLARANRRRTAPSGTLIRLSGE
ncbi:MAG: hypothetical protein LBF24_03025, partial [Puniceicoccales bacterium]|nr:hypothetical protein [Puniceicoccales bacterium]